MSKLIQAKNTASVLIETLPYIQKFSGKTMVIKFGGNAMSDYKSRSSFARDIVLLKLVGVKVVVVHGGGPQINSLLDRLSIDSHFVDGMRVTDTATMDAVEMVLGSTVNKDIVSLIHRNGGKAIGITGKDGNLITARKLRKKKNSSSDLDVGLIGEVDKIDISPIHSLLNGGFTPVIAPIGMDKNGITYNINADLVAGKIAEAMHAEKLLLLTNIDGVVDKDGHTIPRITIKEVDALIESGVITKGMIPKINCAKEAIMNNVTNVHIINGTEAHAILLETYTDAGIGTLIDSS